MGDTPAGHQHGMITPSVFPTVSYYVDCLYPRRLPSAVFKFAAQVRHRPKNPYAAWMQVLGFNWNAAQVLTETKTTSTERSMREQLKVISFIQIPIFAPRRTSTIQTALPTDLDSMWEAPIRLIRPLWTSQAKDENQAVTVPV